MGLSAIAFAGDATLAEGKKLLERGELRAAREKLRRAALEDPDRDGEAARLLRKHGYREYGAGWIHKDEVPAREKAEERRAAKRRADLELSAAFKLDRRDDVRIFTDHSSREAVPFTEKLHRLVRSLRHAHERLFSSVERPAEGADLPPGIDVVVFQSRADYETASGLKDTLGAFLPARQASLFFLGETAPRDLAPVLLHEVCHELNAKRFAPWNPPPWLEEGIATCFEGARISPEGEVELTAALPADAAARLAGPCAPGTARWWGLARLAGLPDARPLHGTEAVHDFYAQSALAVRTLLDGGDASRVVLFDLVEKARVDARAQDGRRDLEDVLAKRGVAMGELESSLERAAKAKGM